MGSLMKPDSGSVCIDDVDINKLKDRHLAQLRNEKIGFVFQFHQLLPEFTALENVCIPALIRGRSRKQAELRAKELLDFMHLGHRFAHKPSELSGGEQQRVAIARALVNSPRVVFADEPSGNLDSKNKTELHEFFFKLRDAFHQTFVIVTHDPGLAGMSDRVISMDDGYIV
jgi:lipoprotein-releasing system ATP-binding protein